MNAKLKPTWGRSIVLGALLGGAVLTMSAASHRNVWIEAPVSTAYAPANWSTCVGVPETFTANHFWEPGYTWEWAGATMETAPDETPSQARRTFTASSPPTYTVTATYKGDVSYPVVVKVFEVQDLTPSEGTPVPGSSPTEYVLCVGSGEVVVTATPKPEVPEDQLPSCWHFTGGEPIDQGRLRRKVSKSLCGATTFTASAGSSSKTLIVDVLDVQITSPALDPPTANNFTYDTTPDPNARCIVPASGTSCVESQDALLEWSLELIAGWPVVTLWSEPTPAVGPNVTFWYTGMPSSNYLFGNKTLTLKHPLACPQVTRTVQIFFPRDAKNHPGAGSGITPNWFFYWKQTRAAYCCNRPDYRDNFFGEQFIGYTPYENGAWRPYLGPLAVTASYPYDGPQWRTRFEGIDLYAYAWRHEARHATVGNTWFPNGEDPSIDADQDLLPDAFETYFTTQQGGPYDPNKWDTDGDGLNDGHDFIYWTQDNWQIGHADDEDWANPGHQSDQ